MKFFEKAIASTDILGYAPGFIVEGKKKQQTFSGGFFTILIIILSILATVSFGKEIFDKSVPMVNVNSQYNDTLGINITQNMGFAVAVYYVGAVEIPDLSRIVKFQVTKRLIRSPTRPVHQEFNFDLVKCVDTKAYKENYRNITANYGVNHNWYWCLPDDFNFYAAGNFGRAGSNQFNMNILPCKNSTANNNTCYSQDVLNQKYGYVVANVLYPNTIIDGNNYDDPITEYFTTTTITVSNIIHKVAIFGYKSIEYTTDSGFMLPNLNTLNSYGFDSYYNEVTVGSDFGLELVLSINPIKTKYMRRYMTLQDLAAKVGGVIKLLMIITTFVNLYITQPYFFEHLYQNYYSNQFLFFTKNNYERKSNL
jgi:hypothetical protein